MMKKLCGLCCLVALLVCIGCSSKSGPVEVPEKKVTAPPPEKVEGAGSDKGSAPAPPPIEPPE